MTDITRAQAVEAVLACDAIAAAAKERAGIYRAFLQGQAGQEYRDQGTAPSWKIPAVGRVTLPITEPTVFVENEAALTAWVQAHHPEHVYAVVRGAFVEHLRKTALVDDDTVLTPDGEPIPGLACRPGGSPKSVSIVGIPAVKSTSLDRARALLSGAGLPELPVGESAVPA